MTWGEKKNLKNLICVCIRVADEFMKLHIGEVFFHEETRKMRRGSLDHSLDHLVNERETNIYFFFYYAFKVHRILE